MQKVLEFIKQNLLVSTSLREREDGDKIKISRNLQHFISMRPFSDIEQTIYEKILSFAISAEKTSPGAGVLFLQKIVDKSSNDVNDKLDIHDRIELMKRPKMTPKPKPIIPIRMSCVFSEIFIVETLV